jgi:hypothetical protein
LSKSSKLVLLNLRSEGAKRKTKPLDYNYFYARIHNLTFLQKRAEVKKDQPRSMLVLFTDFLIPLKIVWLTHQLRPAASWSRPAAPWPRPTHPSCAQQHPGHGRPCFSCAQQRSDRAPTKADRTMAMSRI